MAVTRHASALIVGIGQYDEPLIPSLDGCVYDARRALKWLRRIGVSDANIMLHLSPPPPGGKLDGLLAQDARADTIMRSLTVLSAGSGDQLFLFLSGHGLNIPGARGGRVFLAQDYASDVPFSLKNFRMDGFIQWMLSWRYREQFLFYDACQNPTAEIGRVSLVNGTDPPGLGGLPINAASGMLGCYSASPSQTAWAGDGEGVLMRHVLDALDPDALEALDPDDEMQTVIMHDWRSGRRLVNMRALFEDILAPAISEEAAAAGNQQSPIAIAYGQAQATSAVPILALTDDVTVDLTVTLDPGSAVSAVGQLRISVESPPRNLFLPIGGSAIQSPLTYKAPVGADVRASCRAKVGSGWTVANSPQRATLDTHKGITLQLQPVTPAMTGVEKLDPGIVDKFNIRVARPDGSRDYSLGGRYAQIAAETGIPFEPPPGVTFEHHEHGPDIGFDVDRPRSMEIAADFASHWLRAIQLHSDEGLTASLFPPGEPPADRLANVEFRLADDAIRLGGFLIGSLASFTVEEIGAPTPTRAISLIELANSPRMALEPGPYRVAVSLPWGRWTAVVRARVDGTTMCELPTSIGREPLRNVYLRKLLAGETVGDDLLRPPGEFADLELRVLVGQYGEKTWSEPFSMTTLPDWDLLFSAARPDLIETRRILELSEMSVTGQLAGQDLHGNEASLLMLGMALAAASRDDPLGITSALAHVSGPLRESLDFALATERLKAIWQSPLRFDRQSLTAFTRSRRTLLSGSVPLLTTLCGALGVPTPGWVAELPPGSALAVLPAGFKTMAGTGVEVSRRFPLTPSPDPVGTVRSVEASRWFPLTPPPDPIGTVGPIFPLLSDDRPAKEDGDDDEGTETAGS